MQGGGGRNTERAATSPVEGKLKPSFVCRLTVANLTTWVDGLQYLTIVAVRQHAAGDAGV